MKNFPLLQCNHFFKNESFSQNDQMTDTTNQVKDAVSEVKTYCINYSLIDRVILKTGRLPVSMQESKERSIFNLKHMQ